MCDDRGLAGARLCGRCGRRRHRADVPQLARRRGPGARRDDLARAAAAGLISPALLSGSGRGRGWPRLASVGVTAPGRKVTVTCRTVGGSVTVPVAWSTVPAEADATLPTKEGSWKRTGPAGADAAHGQGDRACRSTVIVMAGPPAVRGREVGHRDRRGPARSQAGGHAAPDHQRAAGPLGHEGVEQHLVGAGHAPGVGRRALPGRGVAARPRASWGRARSSSPTTTTARSGCWPSMNS